MKKIDWKIVVLTSIVSLLPIILGLALYSQLPATIAIHFNLNNQPNNYTTKPIFVFGFPIGMTLFQIIVCVISDLGNKRPISKGLMATFKSVIPFLSVLLYIVTVLFALGVPVDIRRIVMLLLGLFALLLGIFIPNNMTDVNVRKDAKVRALMRAYRLMGVAMMIGGLLMVLSILMIPIYSGISIGIFIILVLLSQFQIWQLQKRK